MDEVVVEEDDETVCLNKSEAKIDLGEARAEEGGDQAAEEAAKDTKGEVTEKTPLEGAEVVTIEMKTRMVAAIRVEVVEMALEREEVGKVEAEATTEVAIEAVDPVVNKLKGFNIATKLANSST